MSTILLVDCDQTGYRRRCLDMEAFGRECLAGKYRRVRKIDGRTYRVACTYADSVPNCYNYPARTSAALVVACVEDDAAIVFGAQIPANKATRSGAAYVALETHDARWLWDGRTDRRDDISWAACVAAYARMWRSLVLFRIDGVPLSGDIRLIA